MTTLLLNAMGRSAACGPLPIVSFHDIMVFRNPPHSGGILKKTSDKEV